MWGAVGHSSINPSWQALMPALYLWPLTTVSGRASHEETETKVPGLGGSPFSLHSRAWPPEPQ